MMSASKVLVNVIMRNVMKLKGIKLAGWKIWKCHQNFWRNDSTVDFFFRV